MYIRNSARAIFINDDKLLVMKVKLPYGESYFLPGGGQDFGESLHETVIRECMEELGVKVDVKRLLFVREYIGKNHPFVEHDQNIHQVDFMFECHIKENEHLVQMGTNPDEGQLALEWVPIQELSQLNFYPNEMLGHLLNVLKGAPVPMYIGDVI